MPQRNKVQAAHCQFSSAVKGATSEATLLNFIVQDKDAYSHMLLTATSPVFGH